MYDNSPPHLTPNHIFNNIHPAKSLDFTYRFHTLIGVDVGAKRYARTLLIPHFLRKGGDL